MNSLDYIDSIFKNALDYYQKKFSNILLFGNFLLYLQCKKIKYYDYGKF